MCEILGVANVQKTAKILNFVSSLTDVIEDSGTPKECVLLKLLNGQIDLLLENNEVYSGKGLVFVSILHSVLPHAYHFAGGASGVILPPPSTLR